MEGTVDSYQCLLSEFAHPLRPPLISRDRLQGVSRFEPESLRVLLVGRDALEFEDLLPPGLTPNLVPVASLEWLRLRGLEFQNDVAGCSPYIFINNTELLHLLSDDDVKEPSLHESRLLAEGIAQGLDELAVLIQETFDSATIIEIIRVRPGRFLNHHREHSSLEIRGDLRASILIRRGCKLWVDHDRPAVDAASEHPISRSPEGWVREESFGRLDAGYLLAAAGFWVSEGFEKFRKGGEVVAMNQDKTDSQPHFVSGLRCRAVSFIGALRNGEVHRGT